MNEDNPLILTCRWCNKEFECDNLESFCTYCREDTGITERHINAVTKAQAVLRKMEGTKEEGVDTKEAMKLLFKARQFIKERDYPKASKLIDKSNAKTDELIWRHRFKIFYESSLVSLKGGDGEDGETCIDWDSASFKAYRKESVKKLGNEISHTKSLDIEWEKTEEEIEQFSIEEIFLTSPDGILLNHYTRRNKSVFDVDLLSAMFVAVQMFVKESFEGVTGCLDELRFGDLVVQIGRGDTIIIAAIMTGKTPEPLHDEIRAAIAEIEKNHKESFLNWEGDVQGLDFLHEYMKKLVLREYKKPHFAS